jgi:hypothetical protein
LRSQGALGPVEVKGLEKCHDEILESSKKLVSLASQGEVRERGTVLILDSLEGEA